MKFFPILALTLLVVAGVSAQSAMNAVNSDNKTVDMNYLNIPFKTITGQSTDLAAYKGKVVLIVNVASKCGHTPQYAGLEQLYKNYANRGFVILGFPANDFHQQEPGTDQEILQFCTQNYGVTFPMMSKIVVKGEGEHPLYTYLTTQSPKPGDITWNFNKFLLDRQGRVIDRFDTKIEPTDPQLIAEVEKLLAQ